MTAPERTLVGGVIDGGDGHRAATMRPLHEVPGADEQKGTVMVAVDPQRRYLLSDPDVNIHDKAFVRALSTEQFNDLLAQSLAEKGAMPADLDGKPASLTEGDAVVFFSGPSTGTTES